jgi:hypothetical protein
MSEDRRRPEQYASLRDRRLRPWIADTVYPYCAPVRAALDRAVLGRRGVRTAADLERLPIVPIADLGDGRSHVLEPDAPSIARFGPLADRVRLRVADAFGRRPELARTRIDPVHRPVLWTAVTTSGEVLHTAWTTSDLDQLSVLGRRALVLSGIGVDDRVLVLEPAGPAIGTWQLVAGCRDGGVPTMHLGTSRDPDAIASAAPTVLAGTADSLAEVAERGLPDPVRLLVAFDGDAPPDPETDPLRGSGMPVARWWSPPGARAAWVRCVGGSGYHTWPTHEVTDVVDGELVWSAVGWRGSVWLRVATGVAAARHDAACPACGRTTPRIEPVVRPRWMRVLDASSDLSGWLAVRRTDGSVVVLASPSASAPDGWRASLADAVGLRVVRLAPDRHRRARALAGRRDIVDESEIADALRKVGAS